MTLDQRQAAGFRRGSQDRGLIRRGMRARHRYLPALLHRAFRSCWLRLRLSERLPTQLEVGGLLRQAQAGGGFAVVLRRGDPDRGDLVVQISERGEPVAMLERRLSPDFSYHWVRQDAIEDLAQFLENRAHRDPDFWLIELDVADAERFVAEMTAMG